MNKPLTGFALLSLTVFLIPVTYDIWNLGNMTGTALSVFLLCYGLFYAKVNRWLRKQRRNLVLTFFGLAVFVFVILGVVLGCLMFTVSESEVSDATLVVLGCDVQEDRPSIMLQERLDRALEYLETHPETPIVCAGGIQEEGELSESTAMKNYLMEHGISETQIYTEDNSTSTFENLANTIELIEIYQLPKTLEVVSSDFHLYRITEMAQALNLDIHVLSAKTAWFLLPTYYIRECAGIIYYVLNGK